ncbi:glycosyltransferase family 4 protein [Patescibacteria group bacterium]|nr:glycosyltransferase family 4 protein [Patescibacteria group bacterium]
MKICLINNLYKPYQRGGTERVIELAVNELIKNHQVLVITTQPEGIKNCLAEGNLKLCRFNPRNIYYLLDDYKMSWLKKCWWHFFDLFNFNTAAKIESELNNFQPELIITHNLKGFSYQIPKIIRKLKMPHIHILHDYQLIDPHGSMYRQGQNLTQIGPFLWLYSRITRALFKSPDMVISPSKFVLDKHLEYGFFKGSKTAVLPNPCIIKDLRPKTQDPTRLKLLFLGQVESHKGVEFLVRTFMKWPEPNSELLIVGQGSQLESIKELIKVDNRIKILGKVDYQQIDQIFYQSNILIVPSIWWDNSPTVIYEAYNHQVPVLVSDSGGSKELVIEGQTGFIFKSADENDLLKKWDHLKIIKEDLKDYGQNGYEFVQQFSADKYVQQLLTLCQELKK